MNKPSFLLLLLFLSGSLSAQTESAGSGQTVIIGFTPDLLLTLALASSQPEGRQTQALSGTLYFGAAAGHQEVMFGVGGSSYNFEVLGQIRRYWSPDCRGVFAGLYGSASWMRAGMEFLPDGSFKFPSEGGTVFHSAGLRFGGNVGVRWDFGGIALSPRLGLMVPALVNFGYQGLTGEQEKTLYLANAFLRAIDFAVVIEFLNQGRSTAP